MRAYRLVSVLAVLGALIAGCADESPADAPSRYCELWLSFERGFDSTYVCATIDRDTILADTITSVSLYLFPGHSIDSAYAALLSLPAGTHSLVIQSGAAWRVDTFFVLDTTKYIFVSQNGVPPACYVTISDMPRIIM